MYDISSRCDKRYNVWLKRPDPTAWSVPGVPAPPYIYKRWIIVHTTKTYKAAMAYVARAVKEQA